MRTRFCPTMRRPAFSIMALIAPVRLRSVASGLWIEKVRSRAIVDIPSVELIGRVTEICWLGRLAAAYTGRPKGRQDAVETHEIALSDVRRLQCLEQRAALRGRRHRSRRRVPRRPRRLLQVAARYAQPPSRRRPYVDAPFHRRRSAAALARRHPLRR